MCALNTVCEKPLTDEAVDIILERWKKALYDIKRKCENCKWHNQFWEESGCSKLNAKEPCMFEPKEDVGNK